MKRKPAALVFKPYTMAQPQLLPPSLDELIEPDHLVREQIGEWLQQIEQVNADAQEADHGLSATAGEVRAAGRDAGGALELCHD